MCAIDITAEQRKTVLALLARHLPNTTAWVYGSRVKWTSRPESDLDLVVFAKPEQERRVSDLREAFEESNLPFRVDLFVWDDVPEQFRKHIEAEHVVLVEREERSVGREWQATTLGDLVDITHGFAFKGHFIHDEPRGDVLLTPGNFAMGGGFKGDKFKYYNGLVPEEFVLREGDFLVTMTDLSKQSDTLGYPAFVPACTDGRRYLHNQRLGKISLKEIASTHARYLYYVMCGAEYRDEVLASATGTTVKHTSPDRIKRFHFPVPHLPEQLSGIIAHVLGTLDDKIELNRRMNRTLEEMARALFKSWFVDFDPVCAKATLKQHDTNHSPLEGESARQGRSPQSSRWGEMKRSYTQQTLERAKTLRQYQTDAEGLLWHYLRNKQLDGYNFRRQQPIGPYIVDFACMSRKLVIELDGGQHAEQHTYDKKHDDYLRGKGYRILHFWNNEVFQNCMDVLEAVYQALVGPPPHQPSPGGSASATPPQGGSDWSVERARAYLDRMDPNIAALFPDNFVDSELGEIPKGWKPDKLGSYVEFQNGYAFKSSDWQSDGVPVVKISSVKPGLVDLTATSYVSADTVIGLERFKLSSGDILVGMTGYPGETGLVPTHDPRPYLNQRVGRIAARQDQPQTYAWIYAQVRNQSFKQYVEARAHGSAQANVSGQTLLEYPVVFPGAALIRNYSSRVTPLIGMFLENDLESRTLAALRDALLPKLISGELREVRQTVREAI